MRVIRGLFFLASLRPSATSAVQLLIDRKSTIRIEPIMPSSFRRTLMTLLVFSSIAKTVGAAAEIDKRAVTIFSDGVRMVGDLYVPSGLAEGERRAAVIFCAGTAGTRKGFPEKIAAQFAQA